jgi:PHD/YefM family antitoxin component YafN of YafNO toxin-antitoxin module
MGGAALGPVRARLRLPSCPVRFRTVSGYASRMTTIKAEEARIPRRAREAVARHELVVVVNHERPAYVIVHPDDYAQTRQPRRLGRPLGEALELLAMAAPPDAAFAEDMEAVLDEVGPVPDDPWARS